MLYKPCSILSSLFPFSLVPLRGTESVSCSVRHVTFSACWSILSSAVRFLSEPSMAVAAGQSIGQPTSRSSPSSSSSISHLHSAAGRLTLAASDFIGVFFRLGSPSSAVFWTTSNCRRHLYSSSFRPTVRVRSGALLSID